MSGLFARPDNPGLVAAARRMRWVVLASADIFTHSTARSCGYTLDIETLARPPRSPRLADPGAPKFEPCARGHLREPHAREAVVLHARLRRRLELLVGRDAAHAAQRLPDPLGIRCGSRLAARPRRAPPCFESESPGAAMTPVYPSELPQTAPDGTIVAVSTNASPG